MNSKDRVFVKKTKYPITLLKSKGVMFFNLCKEK